MERPERVDFAQLSLYLRILGVPNRLELLQKLQVPKSVWEIGLTAARASRRHNPDRKISRQAVEGHLRKLEALKLVNSNSSERDGRPVTEYVVNHARLFVLLDELRRLAAIRATTNTPHVTEAKYAPTMTGGDSAMPEGPALVLANGPLEGAVFPLADEGPWTIGRDKGLDVTLSYDPFISRKNTRIHAGREAWIVECLPGTRNGTKVNWRRLDDGARAPIEAGDALVVGRSLLFVRGL